MESCLSGLLKRGFIPRHVVDIGASHGPWTRMGLSLWPEARFSLFEPLSEHAGSLDLLRTEHPGVLYFPCALGSQRTSLPISIYPDHLDAASLAYGGPGSRNIPVERLDDVMAGNQLPPVDLIKIDVQGFEQEVLAGATTTMTRAGVAIIESYFYRFASRMLLIHELITYMHERGFRVYEFLDPIRRPHDEAYGQCDICFVREGHPLLESNAWH